MRRFSDGKKKYPYRKGKGINGRPLCRVCGNEVAPGRRTFCGEDCVHTYRMETSSGYLRQQVKKRDKGICALCGLDTEGLRHRMRKMGQVKYGAIKGWYGSTPELTELLFELIEKGFNLNQSLWEADHIKPFCEGGKHTLENLQTLCPPCHWTKTCEMMQNRRRAAKAKK